jgi:ribosomal protein S18 acetylase RimI-like enzyme
MVIYYLSYDEKYRHRGLARIVMQMAIDYYLTA